MAISIANWHNVNIRPNLDMLMSFKGKVNQKKKFTRFIV